MVLSDPYFDFANRAFTNNLTGIPGQGDTTILSLQYYLGRVDKVFMSKNSIIQIVKGAPASNPVSPDDRITFLKGNSSNSRILLASAINFVCSSSDFSG